MQLEPHIAEAFKAAGVTVWKAHKSRPNAIEVMGKFKDHRVEYTLAHHTGPSCYGYLIVSCTEEAGDTWEPIQALLMAGPKDHCAHVNDWSAWVLKRSQEPIDLSNVRPEAIKAVLDALRR